MGETAKYFASPSFLNFRFAIVSPFPPHPCISAWAKILLFHCNIVIRQDLGKAFARLPERRASCYAAPVKINTTRRTAIKAAVGAALLPLFGAQTAEAAKTPFIKTPVNVVVPTDYTPPLTGQAAKNYQWRLAKAVLEYAHDEYSGRNIPVWRTKLESVDLEKRVVNIVYWIMRGCAENENIYPVDPAWVAAQIMAESFFYEFAVSWALAVGVCQFIAPTARDYGMLTAGDKPEHGDPPYAKHEDAGQIENYYETRSRWKQALRARRKLSGKDDMLKKSLEAAARGEPLPEAMAYIKAWDRVDRLDEEVKDARAKSRAYLEANFQGRSIFNSADLEFLVGFDERVTYNKPVRSMCKMLARHLAARKGNIIAAAAGYHAGLGSTCDSDRVYAPYGRIPAYEETVGYISHVFINHHEIVRRI